MSKPENLTILEWLDSFISDEKIRTQAKSNIIVQKGESFLTSKIVNKNTLSSFCKLFSFYETPEGTDYWLDFASTLKK